MLCRIALAVAIGTGQVAHAGVSRYEGTVSLNPAAGLHARLTIVYEPTEDGVRTAEFYLNSGLKVRELRCDQCETFAANPARSGALQNFPFSMPITASFRRPLRQGEAIPLEIEYAGTPILPSEDSNRFSPSWTELNVESLWFPMEGSSRSFLFKLRIQTPPRWGFTGNGQVSIRGGTWHFQQRNLADDIVLITAPDLHTQTVEINGTAIEIQSGGRVSSEDSQQIAIESEKMLQAFGQWFGPPAAKSMRLVLNPRQEVSYSRSGFVSLNVARDSAARTHMLEMLSHEIAHFWWHGAQTDTWENWLNEGFAEYSALLYVRTTRGDQEYQQRIEELRQRTKDLPPIWGLDRYSRNAYPVLYLKGALRLSELDQSIGKVAFERFLAGFARESVKSTEKLLQILESQTNKSARAEFERRLRY